MPTTSGLSVRSVADIVQVLTKCSKANADAAEAEICRSPKAVETLLAACALSTVAVGMGGRLLVTSPVAGGSTAVPGAVLLVGGLVGAKKFCFAAVDRVTK
jgi:hypothetical protein